MMENKKKQGISHLNIWRVLQLRTYMVFEMATNQAKFSRV